MARRGRGIYHRVLPLDLLLALCCALLLGVAIALQKRGVRESFREMLRSPAWVGGVLVEMLGDACYLGAASAEGARITVMQPIVTLHFLVAMGAGLALLRERFSRREWIAASILLAGGALILGAAFATSPAVEREVHPTAALLAASALALVGGIGGALLRKHEAREIFTSVAAGLALAGAIVTTRVAGIEWRAHAGGVGAFLVGSAAPALVVVESLAGFALMQVALRAGRAAVVSPVVALVTLVVPLPVSVLAFHEPVPLVTAIGSVLVAAALTMFLVVGRHRRPTEGASVDAA